MQTFLIHPSSKNIPQTKTKAENPDKAAHHFAVRVLNDCRIQNQKCKSLKFKVQTKQNDVFEYHASLSLSLSPKKSPQSKKEIAENIILKNITNQNQNQIGGTHSHPSFDRYRPPPLQISNPANRSLSPPRKPSNRSLSLPSSLSSQKYPEIKPNPSLPESRYVNWTFANSTQSTPTSSRIPSSEPATTTSSRISSSEPATQTSSRIQSNQSFVSARSNSNSVNWNPPPIFNTITFEQLVNNHAAATRNRQDSPPTAPQTPRQQTPKRAKHLEKSKKKK